MSRPHDGQKSFFAFGNPFRVIFPKGSYHSPKLLALLYPFEKILSERLRNLKSSEKSYVLSLSWMRRAIKCLCNTHTDIKALITDLQYPVADWDEKWMDMYFDNSVKLLDMCIALTSEVSHLGRQLLMKYILHILDSTSGKSPSSEQQRKVHESLHKWMQQIYSRSDKLDSCSVILQDLVGTLGSTKVKSTAKGKVLLGAFYAVKVVTIFICSAIAAALSGSSKLLIELQVPDNFLWAESFKCLQAEAVDELKRDFSLSRGKLVLVKELEEVEEKVQTLHVLISGEKDASNCGAEKSRSTVREDVTREQQGAACQEMMVPENGSDLEERGQWSEAVAHLAQSSENLTSELELLSNQVNNFFEIVLDGRDALLCNLRNPDASSKQNSNDAKV